MYALGVIKIEEFQYTGADTLKSFNQWGMTFGKGHHNVVIRLPFLILFEIKILLSAYFTILINKFLEISTQLVAIVWNNWVTYVTKRFEHLFTFQNVLNICLHFKTFYHILCVITSCNYVT